MSSHPACVVAAPEIEITLAKSQQPAAEITVLLLGDCALCQKRLTWPQLQANSTSSNAIGLHCMQTNWIAHGLQGGCGYVQAIQLASIVRTPLTPSVRST